MSYCDNSGYKVCMSLLIEKIQSYIYSEGQVCYKWESAVAEWLVSGIWNRVFRHDGCDGVPLGQACFLA